MRPLISGQWSYRLRGILYGGIIAGFLTPAVGLCFAAARDERPFRKGKAFPSTSIDFATEIAMPIAVPLGAIAGLAIANRANRRR